MEIAQDQQQSLPQETTVKVTQRTHAPSKSNFWMVSIFALLPFIFLLGIYTLNQRKQATPIPPPPSPTSSPPISTPIPPSPTPDSTVESALPNKPDLCIEEKNDLINLVKQFEDLQTNRDGLAVLSLFTPASTAEDVATYNHLSGKDTNNNPRLYSAGATNFKLLSYTIVQRPEKTSTTSCNLLIQEDRQYWRQGIGGWLDPVSITIRFEIVKQEQMWKIDKYQATTDRNYQGKYSGW